MQKFIFSIPDANSNNRSPDVANTRLLNWAVLEEMKLYKEWFYPWMEHLRDPVGNAVAKAVSKEGGCVMVSTRLMANHMARYPASEVYSGSG